MAKRIARSTNKQKPNDSGDGDDDDGSVSKQSQGQHKIGDYVRATYEDGLDYEAKIISIDSEHENCVVRFIGYENEETIELNDLLPSWGKNVRKKQMRSAAKDLTGDSKSTLNFPNNSLPNSVPVPLLPPIPPMLNDTTGDSENMSAMLMSWYMSGYYTGYYQGQKDAQNKIHKK